jgi:hypothetical protein
MSSGNKHFAVLSAEFWEVTFTSGLVPGMKLGGEVNFGLIDHTVNRITAVDGRFYTDFDGTFRIRVPYVKTWTCGCRVTVAVSVLAGRKPVLYGDGEQPYTVPHGLKIWL